MGAEKEAEHSPQVEDGYTRIANELLEALIDIRMPGEVRRVFDFILRMTYGYHRKTFDTTQRKISRRLNTSQQRVFEALRWLTRANMVVNTKNRVDLSSDCLTTLGIQKRYRLWSPTRKTVSTRKSVLSRNVKPCCINTEKRVFTYKEKSKDNFKEKGMGALDAPPSLGSDNKKENPLKKRRQLPPDFSLTDDLKVYAEGQGINGNRVESVFAHFCDHHRAKGSVMLDWTAAWRTWVRNEMRFNRGKVDKTRPPEDLLKW
jgi:phage replication O-like protein O